MTQPVPAREAPASHRSDEVRTIVISPTEARVRLDALIGRVNDDRTVVEIDSPSGGAVLMALAEYRALEETAYLLRSPANARHRMESLEQARRGETEEHEPRR